MIHFFFMSSRTVVENLSDLIVLEFHKKIKGYAKFYTDLFMISLR